MSQICVCLGNNFLLGMFFFLCIILHYSNGQKIPQADSLSDIKSAKKPVCVKSRLPAFKRPHELSTYMKSPSRPLASLHMAQTNSGT